MPNLLITDIPAAVRWADTALGLRLDRLAFAINRSQKQLLFQGTPLPPLAGERFTLQDRIALPAGYDFDLPLTHKELATRLALADDGFALFNPDATYTWLADDLFVPATRASLRLLDRQINDDSAYSIETGDA